VILDCDPDTSKFIHSQLLEDFQLQHETLGMSVERVSIADSEGKEYEYEAWLNRLKDILQDHLISDDFNGDLSCSENSKPSKLPQIMNNLLIDISIPIDPDEVVS
jgi:hypothetical protein